jgi:hypothetical protein
MPAGRGKSESEEMTERREGKGRAMEFMAALLRVKRSDYSVVGLIHPVNIIYQDRRR